MMVEYDNESNGFIESHCSKWVAIGSESDSLNSADSL